MIGVSFVMMHRDEFSQAGCDAPALCRQPYLLIVVSQSQPVRILLRSFGQAAISLGSQEKFRKE